MLVIICSMLTSYNRIINVGLLLLTATETDEIKKDVDGTELIKRQVIV